MSQAARAEGEKDLFITPVRSTLIRYREDDDSYDSDYEDISDL